MGSSKQRYINGVSGTEHDHFCISSSPISGKISFFVEAKRFHFVEVKRFPFLQKRKEFIFCRSEKISFFVEAKGFRFL